MLVNRPPVSNTERQRQFRERNPGYYGRLHRKRQAELVAMMQQAQLSAASSAAQAPLLMLPAPVEQDVLLQQMAEMKSTPVRETVTA
jgi:hypothetical protein